MPKSRSAKKGRRSSTSKSRNTKSRSRATSRAGSNGRGRDDAISLLKADHREAERLFEQFESARSSERQQELAGQVCRLLRTHTAIEEEIFYPAFLEATGETEIHHEAEIEHAGATHLIEEIESSGPEDDHFEARLSVLKEMIRHHVNEEERRGGMFTKANGSEMDLRDLGRQLQERKLELLGEAGEDLESAPASRRSAQSRSRRGGREMRARSS